MTSESIEVDGDGNAYVDMRAPEGMRMLILDHPVLDGYCVRLQVHVAGSETAVIDRDANSLTPREVTTRAAAVAAAVR
eukprot:9026253-Pyramimonas_sp.AAC.1